jgi:hypothetical protein
VFVARPNGSDAASTRVLCGVEHWSVKTLQDRPRLLPVRRTTVAHLASLPPPSDMNVHPPSIVIGAGIGMLVLIVVLLIAAQIYEALANGNDGEAGFWAWLRFSF